MMLPLPPPPRARIKVRLLYLFYPTGESQTFKVGEEDPLFPDKSMVTSDNSVHAIEVLQPDQGPLRFRYKTGVHPWRRCWHTGDYFMMEL